LAEEKGKQKEHHVSDNFHHSMEDNEMKEGEGARGGEKG